MAGDDWRGAVTGFPDFERATDRSLVYDLGRKGQQH